MAATLADTYVPTFQGLSALDFVKSARRPSAFPFNAPERIGFFRARNAIYHLFTALRSQLPKITVLVPDYNSGNEVLAMQAAGATLIYYPVDRHMQADPQALERLCQHHHPDLLYVIHYLGWPQPMRELSDLCARREMLLIEDCALSLLSEPGGRPLGSYGHWSVFCLYKTLPVPNGSLLVQNANRLAGLERLRLRQAGTASVAGRIGELLVQRIRSRANRAGAALQNMKRRLGRAAGAMDVNRANVGDLGFSLSDVDLRMSGTSERLLARLDFDDIRHKRVWNFQTLATLLNGCATPAMSGLDAGVCPLFYPVLVRDKAEAARALRERGVDALEFWNHGATPDNAGESPTTRLLRSHVLALPVHQDLTTRHLVHMARQMESLRLQYAC
jgi:dTDP-4-amino-4,6-dideoxygalactose transaminase